MKIHEDHGLSKKRLVGSPALPGCAIRGKSQTNAPNDDGDAFVCDFPLIVPAAKGGAQPGAFMELHALHGESVLLKRPWPLRLCVSL